jgi:tRNA (mo5U34)-methyltransferase
MSIDLVTPSHEFSKVMDHARAQVQADFEWYRYDTLWNLTTVQQFLTPEHLEIARSRGVLDVGCADGDLAFFFESLGCNVVAVDHPAPNHNGMRGVRKLKEVLKSRVEIMEVDLDTQFTPFDRRFGLTLFLGALYHVKNPFYILENLSKFSDYCLLSTRIARRFPAVGRIPKDTSLAYLLAADELNADNTNFWIFSEAGLKTLLKRTWWTVCDFVTVGDTSDSDPNSLEHDERAFCLLRSRYGLAHVDLGTGWHNVEQGGWRWTERTFSVRVQPGAVRLTMEVYVPPESLKNLGPMRMDIDGLEPVVFNSPGLHTITRPLGKLPVDSSLTFHSDKAYPPDQQDPRERAMIVSAIVFD